MFSVRYRVTFMYRLNQRLFFYFSLMILSFSSDSYLLPHLPYLPLLFFFSSPVSNIVLFLSINLHLHHPIRQDQWQVVHYLCLVILLSHHYYFTFHLFNHFLLLRIDYFFLIKSYFLLLFWLF